VTLDQRIDLLERVAEATAVHRDEIVLCGGMAAFLICRAAYAPVDAAMTEDVDLTVELRDWRQKTLKSSAVPTLADSLEKAGFSREIQSQPIGETQATEKWVQDGSSFYIEFLTEDPRQKLHRISGIQAQGLSYFSMSLENTFLYRLPSGKEIRVVSGSAFIMHKILTFNRRKTGFKKFKDLYYVAFVGTASFQSPEDLAENLRGLKIHPNWTKTAFTNLKTVSTNLSSWAPRIKDNDPTGALSEPKIVDFYNRLKSAYSHT
jgi:hypothetical protein